MSTSMTPASTSMSQATTSQQSQSQAGSSSTSAPAPAAPPSRSEIERKLSFRSAAGPPARPHESPKKPKRAAAPVLPPNTFSGNDSDSSSITSSSHPALTSPISPLISPNAASVGGLGAIAEMKRRGEIVEEADEMELEDVEEEGEDEGEESEEVEVEGGALQRGMEGERVLKSGYLLKKQERRKAWKRKWFVLRTNKLAYYKDDREYSLKRVLDLKSVQAVAPVTIKKHSFSFGIVTAKRTFLAKASSQDEMDDWVRAINSARRKLSEREEEDRHKRTGAPATPMAVPSRDRPETIDTHMGTYSTILSSTTGGSISASPIAVGGYFTQNPAAIPAPHSASPLSSPAVLAPSSPLDTTNTLASQMAKMNMPKSGSGSTAVPGRMPQGRSISSTAQRREPSASSVGSSDQHHQMPGEYGGQYRQQLSSDEDEPFYSDPNVGLQNQVGSLGQSSMLAQRKSSVQSQVQPVDPNKVILSAYLMKRSKGRGRKVWRKRWFYLTSQGLTYTKSHMDSRPLRYIPLTAVLDALEFQPNETASEASDSDLDAVSETGGPSKPARSFSMRGRDTSTSSKRAEKPVASPDEHLFRIVTAKRNIVLCAPSEEDEIKWLAAFRALLTRQRDRSVEGTPLSPAMDGTPRITLPQNHGMGVLPLIMNQPPTPASTVSGTTGEVPPTPSVNTSAGPPVLERPTEGANAGQSHAMGSGHGGAASPIGGGMLGSRGRSATYIAKGAVAEVVRRFHPEHHQRQQQQQQKEVSTG